MNQRWFVLLFIWPISAQADTLFFRNGAKLTGSWVSVDTERVSFMVDGQVRVYSRSDVSAVTFGSAPATPAGHVPAVRAPAEPEHVGAVNLREESAALQPLESR